MADAEMEEIARQLAECQLEDETSISQERAESINRCIESLVHACICRNASCRSMSCHKMKRVVGHTKVCQKRQGSRCPVCSQLIALCAYHAKRCEVEQCMVPFCLNLRGKIAAQKAAAAAAATG